MLVQWTMDPEYIAVTELFTKHGVYIAYKNAEPGATTPKTFLVRSRSPAKCTSPSCGRVAVPYHDCAAAPKQEHDG